MLNYLRTLPFPPALYPPPAALPLPPTFNTSHRDPTTGSPAYPTTHDEVLPPAHHASIADLEDGAGGARRWGPVRENRETPRVRQAAVDERDIPFNRPMKQVLLSASVRTTSGAGAACVERVRTGLYCA